MYGKRYDKQSQQMNKRSGKIFVMYNPDKIQYM